MASVEYQYQRWQHPYNQRYYEMILEEDLLGWCLTRIWGRRGSRLGRIMHQPCDSYAQGIKDVDKIGHQHRRHGYALMCVHVSPLVSLN